MDANIRAVIEYQNIFDERKLHGCIAHDMPLESHTDFMRWARKREVILGNGRTAKILGNQGQ